MPLSGHYPTVAKADSRQGTGHESMVFVAPQVGSRRDRSHARFRLAAGTFP